MRGEACKLVGGETERVRDEFIEIKWEVEEAEDALVLAV